MFRVKFFTSISIFIFLLILTSTIKNQTRSLEKKIDMVQKKVLLKEKDLHETQLDFSYLTSPFVIEKKLKYLEKNNYIPMDHSKIFLNILDFDKIEKKFAISKNHNDKKIQKK